MIGNCIFASTHLFQLVLSAQSGTLDARQDCGYGQGYFGAECGCVCPWLQFRPRRPLTISAVTVQRYRINWLLCTPIGALRRAMGLLRLSSRRGRFNRILKRGVQLCILPSFIAVRPCSKPSVLGSILLFRHLRFFGSVR